VPIEQVSRKIPERRISLSSQFRKGGSAPEEPGSEYEVLSNVTLSGLQAAY